MWGAFVVTTAAGVSQSGCDVFESAHPAWQVGPSPQYDESHVTQGVVEL